MEAIIMAGGKGSRIASLNDQAPKPMLNIAGKPILEWQIECLRRQGINDITIAIGHLGSVIKDYFKDSVSYIEEHEPLGTAGALYLLKDKIKDDFLLINGDVVFDVDFGRFISAHRNANAAATLFTHPNDHPFDSGIVVSDGNGRVTGWLTKEDERGWYKNQTNAGLHILSRKIIQNFTMLKKLDLDRDVLKPMIGGGGLFAYKSCEYVKDIGTPKRFYEVEDDILSGKVAAKNLANKQKAVFLDRDGVINKYVGFLRNIDDFELTDDISEAIKLINKSGYLAIVVTNQPVIARGEVTWEQLSEIHNKMETLLGENGAYIDDIYICPHHPDKGFAGERLEYKIECECRKPKPGLLFDAAMRYNINLSGSIIVGDSETDILAGQAAGCRSMRIIRP